MKIQNAFHGTAQSRSWAKDTGKDFERFSNVFCVWCENKKITEWEQITQSAVKKYEIQLGKRRLAKRTIELHLWPIKLAAKWAVIEAISSQDFMQGYRITKRAGAISYQGGQNNYLTFPDMLDLIKQIEKPGVRLAVALQGIAGLRLTEALRLNRKNIDLENGTITIDGEVKNKHSARKIPVASVVLDCIRNAKNLVDYSSRDTLGAAISRKMTLWSPEKAVKPKDLRNTLQTEAVLGGWYGYFLELYVGHSPKSIGPVAATHYMGLQGDRRIPYFREHVVSKIELEIGREERVT